MKIIQIMPEFGLAGAEIMCENLIYQLVKKGNTVIAVSLYDFHSPITERLENAGVSVKYLGKKSGLDISMLTKLYRIFKTEKPDVIHTHRYTVEYGAPAAILAGVRRKVHTVHSIARYENGAAARILCKILYRFFGVTPVALSTEVKRTVIEEYKLPDGSVPVIFNGIDQSKCISKTDYHRNGEFSILHIGRFSAVKNHKRLVDAFALFSKEYPDSRLKLIGGGELLDEIKCYVAKLGLSDKVDFLGYKADPFGFLHDADVFTLSSDYEGVPMTIIEAMATGLPIVSTAVGGVPDMLTDGENALLTDIDPVSVKDAWLKLTDDDELREKLGKAAKLRARDFTSEKMADRYMQVYKDR